MYYTLYITFILVIFQGACTSSTSPSQVLDNEARNITSEVKPGSWQIELYLPTLREKKIGMVVNHTSLIVQTHVVDSLLTLGVQIVKIFSPEHGFRGTADAGAHIEDEKDPQTGISIVSLYGNKSKPTQEDLRELDLIVFDIQDVGARFYTYISTLHYVMEACAESQKSMIVFDRPNPNGHYIDGPMREDSFKSFVGMHPVPIVYGMTIGEYAQMINGEGWLNQEVKCDLQVIKCQNYSHETMYDLPVAPSPNLPNLRSVLLYPSLCFFEGTPLSIGRGTSTQFQVIGHPAITEGNYTFTPKPMFGAAKPVLENQLCHGADLTTLAVEEIFAEHKINLQYILDYFRRFPDKSSFFNPNGWFDRLAGTTSLRKAIIAGKTEEEIRTTWETDLNLFKQKRAKYLIYE